MSDDLRALREMAEAATPGPWTVAKWHGGTVITERWAQEEDAPSDRGPFTSIGAANDYDAAFIAAANPTAVLALLDRLEAAEAAVAYHDDWRYCPRCGRPHDWAGELSPGAPCMVCGRYPANRATLDAD